MIGNLNKIHWQTKIEEVDFFAVKGIIEEITENLSLSGLSYVQSDETYYQKGIGADILLKEEKIGSLGKIDKMIAEDFGIDYPAFAFTLNLDKILSIQRKVLPVFTEIPKFPPVLRDLSFVISKNIQVDEIINEVKKVNPAMIKDVVLFDVYEGEHIEKGFRSLSINLVFSSNKKTLTDDFIGKIMNKIIGRLQSQFNVKMR